MTTATSAVGLALGTINGAFNLDVALSALERSGKGRILSTPRITTQNNVEAEITQGVQIPVQTEANNTVTVTFKDAALTLKVTPQITAANTVIMQITLENAIARHPRRTEPDSVDRYAARDYPRAGERRHDHGDGRHLREPRTVHTGSHADTAPHPVPGLVVQARRSDGQQPRAVDFHHAAYSKGLRGMVATKISRVALLALALATASCTASVREGTGTSFLIIESITATAGASDEDTGSLLSDVLTGGGVINDSGTATFRLGLKDPGPASAPLNPT